MRCVQSLSYQWRLNWTAVIQPHMDYGSVIWSNGFHGISNRLDYLETTAIRLIMGFAFDQRTGCLGSLAKNIPIRRWNTRHSIQLAPSGVFSHHSMVVMYLLTIDFARSGPTSLDWLILGVSVCPSLEPTLSNRFPFIVAKFFGTAFQPILGNLYLLL